MPPKKRAASAAPAPAAAAPRKSSRLAASASAAGAVAPSIAAAPAVPDPPKKPSKPRGKSTKVLAAASTSPATSPPLATTADDDSEDKDEDEDEPMLVKAIKKGVAAVDSAVPPSIAQSFHVLELNDALLNQTNIDANNNKFFIIQVLKHDSTERYITWTRYARVGNIGQTQQPEFSDPQSAISAFEHKFKDKTKNRWEDRANFVKYPGKYHYLERDYQEDDETAKDPTPSASSENEPVKTPPSKLDPSVQDLVKLIFDLNLMEKEMVEIGYDAKKMPLGKLTKKTIELGYLELKKISEELSRPGGPRSTVLKELSGDFYTVIPHNFGRNVPQVINSVQLLNQKLKMVEALGDIQITTTLLKQKVDSETNPIDSKFNSLNIGMKPVDKKSDTFKLVETYTANTHGQTHNHYKLKVEDVFELEKEDSYEKKGTKLHNKKLLWHGSRITNFVGILSQGLRIAPPEAPVTGYMFGKGVYFADMVSKSANYCFTTRSNPTGLLLLCEVALGDENALVNSDYHADESMKANGKHSTWGMGRTVPNPKEFVTLPNGVVVPCGKAVTSKDSLTLQYNEFICYDLSQIRLKYLVKMKFEYMSCFRVHMILALAPMVDQCDLPFRRMCRRHGATLVYTQMIVAERFMRDADYRRAVFDPARGDGDPITDRPLVVQLAGSDAEVLLSAARVVAPHCNAIDINMGCPQTHAVHGGYGASLLSRARWDDAARIVRVLSGAAAELRVPVWCKVRLVENGGTVEFARLLERSGCKLIAVHGRYPSSVRRRNGLANLDIIKDVKKAVSIPVLSNGNVRCWGDIPANLETTGADGVMVGEALLVNPRLFSGDISSPAPKDLIQGWVVMFIFTQLHPEYLQICSEIHPDAFSITAARQHVRNFLRPM
ncbi:Poly [ADP-ribose] polymerase 2 [Entophlyctis luteolus]|nr:Poly [ADP-ribose] polymerase 2 [Entophlyctis luteolus]